MAEPIIIAGCGGHGREVLGIVRAINEAQGAVWYPLGFVDDSPSPASLDRVARLGLPYLGPVSSLEHSDPGASYVVGIGSPQVRAIIAAQLDGYGLPATTLIHPAATVGGDVVMADGVLLFAGARVTTNVTLGRHVHLNQNVTVGHDSVLDDYVSINPLAAISGECHLGAGVMVGTTAAVLQRLRVGAGAVVGAGACVTRDVAAGAVVKGVPAR